MENKYSKLMDNKAAYYISLGANFEDICNILGISRMTLNRWKNNHPTFAKALTPPDGVTPYFNQGGSPYTEDMDNIAYKLCLLGATDEEIGDALGVTRLTIHNWKNSKKSFGEAVRKGKILADSEIAASLYKRATGYDHDGKHYPADPKSMISWLAKRRPKDWTESKEYKLTSDMENMTPWEKIESGIAKEINIENEEDSEENYE